jgi:hypothetical protein
MKVDLGLDGNVMHVRGSPSSFGPGPWVPEVVG